VLCPAAIDVVENSVSMADDDKPDDLAPEASPSSDFEESDFSERSVEPTGPPADSSDGPDAPDRVRTVETEEASYEIIGAPSAAKTDLREEPEEPAGPAYRASYVFLAVVTLVNLVADLWSKHWAKSTFDDIRPGGERRMEVVEGFMNFIFAKNKGGAWGLLQNETEAIRRPFFLIVSMAAIVFIVSLYRKLQPGQTALKWGLPLVLGGALGNLVDRIRYGYVVDFIDVYVNISENSFWLWLFKGPGERHWPTFNVADISICVGVALMAIDMFTAREKKSRRAKPAIAKDDEKAGVEGAG
jgi:signal peptidase II